MSDRIEKQIELRASVARVWTALTDSKEFGSWFGVKFETPFALGKPVVGQTTTKGYEHLKWKADITKIEFQRERTPSGGTLLTIAESGFDKIPKSQTKQIEAFLAKSGS